VNFPKDSNLYGIPERINSFILKNTTTYHAGEEADPSNPKEEPYRLWNTDHFEDKFNFHTLYGSIPVLHSRQEGKSTTTGFMWANSSDTFVDIFGDKYHRTTHWFSECGACEFFIFPASNPRLESYKLFLLTG